MPRQACVSKHHVRRPQRGPIICVSKELAGTDMPFSENPLTKQVALKFGAVFMGYETGYETRYETGMKQGMKRV